MGSRDGEEFKNIIDRGQDRLNQIRKEIMGQSKKEWQKQGSADASLQKKTQNAGVTQCVREPDPLSYSSAV